MAFPAQQTAADSDSSAARPTTSARHGALAAAGRTRVRENHGERRHEGRAAGEPSGPEPGQACCSEAVLSGPLPLGLPPGYAAACPNHLAATPCGPAFIH